MPGATAILLGFVDSEVPGCTADLVLPDYALDSLAGRLTVLARDDSSPRPIPYEIYRAIEDLFLEKRPYGNNSQSYTRVPRATNDLKARLFKMVKHDPQRAKSAYILLAQIEEWRLEYGSTPSERRHPVFESGEMWPPAEPVAALEIAGRSNVNQTI